VTFFRQSCLLLALVLLVSVCKAAPYTPETPTHKVATLYTTWHDTARARDVPVKIYYPADAKSPCPVIIFSHGLGGSREGYGYLGETWAGCGYIAVHIQHQGSDDAVWRNANGDGFAALSRAVTDPQNALNRALDVPFAIDQMLALNKNPKSPLYGLINADEIGMAGHSFGAWTTLAVTGEKTVAPDNLVDPRIKAAIAMSAPVVGGGAKAVGQFTDIKVPVFHMTGTRDDSPIGDTTAPERRIPYPRHLPPDPERRRSHDLLRPHHGHLPGVRHPFPIHHPPRQHCLLGRPPPQRPGSRRLALQRPLRQIPRHPRYLRDPLAFFKP